MDSIEVFDEIKFMKVHAKKTNNEILSLFADYSKIRYQAYGNLEMRPQLYQTLVDIQKKLADKPQNLIVQQFMADLEHIAGLVLLDFDKYSEKIIEHLLKARFLYQKIGYQNIFLADKKLTDLALYYYDVPGDVNTALKYLKEGELYIEKNSIDRWRIRFYRTYAKCLVEIKQYDEAIKYNTLAIAQVRTKNDSLSVGTIGGNIGEIILNHSKNPISSEPYFNQELMYRLKYKPKGKDDIAKVYGNLCQVAGLKGDREQVILNFNKAMENFNEYAVDGDDTYTIEMDIYKNRMIADTLLGDFKSAFKFEKLYYEAKIKSNDQQLKIITAEAGVKYESERNKFNATVAEQKAKTFRIWVFVFAILLITAITIGYLFFANQRLKKNELTIKLDYEQKEAERLKVLSKVKANFFANISHEFRTPLTLILGPIEDLIRQNPNNQVYKLIYNNATRLLKLINQLLDLSKLEAKKIKLDLQTVELSDFFNSIMLSFVPLAERKNIEFQFLQNNNEVYGSIDKDKVEKILVNLLSNAFKFTEANKKVLAKIAYENDQLVITISDEGIGIPSGKLGNIFDRFYQIDSNNNRKYEGTGIGLALVKELVDIMNGKIYVESQVNKGTTFEVILPIDVMQNIGTVEKTNKIFASSYDFVENTIDSIEVNDDDQRPILLVVDDNNDIRTYLRIIFESTYQIIEATNGKEGINQAQNQIPDLIISDVMMPEMDGYEFCKYIKSNNKTSHIPIIMLTAKANMESRLEGLEVNVDDYIVKPFNREEIEARVKNLITLREKLRQQFGKELIKLSPDDVKVNSLDANFLNKIKEVLELNVSNQKFDVSEFAAAMNMSSVQLRRKLKSLTNFTVVEFVRNYRLQKAANLLGQGAGTVTEIAYQVGFESLPYFSRVFQEYYGIQPSAYYDHANSIEK
jgi:signal transduction histidine kinase/DNA-binding response OmpR family regulator